MEDSVNVHWRETTEPYWKERKKEQLPPVAVTDLPVCVERDRLMRSENKTVKLYIKIRVTQQETEKRTQMKHRKGKGMEILMG